MLRHALRQCNRLSSRFPAVDGAACCMCARQGGQPSTSGSSAWPTGGWRSMISVDTEEADGADPHVAKLAEEIMKLNLLQVADLTEILQSRLGIAPPAFGAMAGPAAGAAQPAAAVAPEAEKPPEKTDFDVKLTGFDAASKIRVIKEVRAMTDLGLKEAKELVEKAPVIIKPGLKKEEAEELKKKLEAAGGKVELE